MIGHDKRFVTTVCASLYGVAVCTCVSPAIKNQPRDSERGFTEKSQRATIIHADRPWPT